MRTGMIVYVCHTYIKKLWADLDENFTTVRAWPAWQIMSWRQFKAKSGKFAPFSTNCFKYIKDKMNTGA